MMIRDLYAGMTAEQKSFLHSLINRLGDGDHPYADEKTSPYFEKGYVCELLIKAEGKLSEEGNKLLTELKDIFKE